MDAIMTETTAHKTNFIINMIESDLENNKHQGKVVTRFPPEPNGYLHIGHAKSICLNFGIAEKYAAPCYLRFDDTNPEKEDIAYVEAIKEDVKWLGYDWGDKLAHTSDYFDKLYEYAVQLIKQGDAYVCSLTGEEVKNSRGTLQEPGTESSYRVRSIEENIDMYMESLGGMFDILTPVIIVYLLSSVCSISWRYISEKKWLNKNNIKNQKKMWWNING